MRLFLPWLKTSASRLFPKRKFGVNSALILLAGTALCVVIYMVSLKVLTYFHSQNELGVILSLKIFQMTWVMVFAMLIFSSMISAISTFYLAEDNEILLSSPVNPAEIYLMRFVTTAIHNSWMILIFSFPVFGAYGKIFETGFGFWTLLLIAVPSITFVAAGLATALTVVLVYYFPAKRTKDIVLYLSLCFGLFLYLVFRMIRPEDLVNPEKYGQFIDYFSAVSAPAGPWLPAGWAANMLTTFLLDRTIDWLLVLLLVTTPFVLFFFGQFLMDKLFVGGYSKSQESFGGHQSFKPVKRFPSVKTWIFRKELRSFVRDSSEWSQFFMIAALIVVYLYNFKALPLERSPMPTEFITNLVAFANIGLSGFLAASLATRFVYPSISAEKGAYYLISTSPLSWGRYLWYKFQFYFIPFTLLSLCLIVVSNNLLQIVGPMQWISVFVGLVMTWASLGMALGFGMYFADFKSESRAGAMEPGAILFLFCAVIYQLAILLSGARITFRLVRKSLVYNSIPLFEMAAGLLWAVGIVSLSVLIIFLLCNRAVRKKTIG